MKKKVGVYICHCGGNISDYVDVEKVRQSVESINGVYLAKTTMFACADSNQKDMVEDIREQNLDGVVVAACSPKLHLLTFRAVVERAGMNKYNFVHANIREQVSWAHSDNKTGATEKAIQIVKAAIAKVQNSEALEPVKVQATKAVAVIGAGVAGMRAAIELAEAGSEVYLIERSFFVGGRIAQWDNICGTEETGKELVTRLYDEVIKHKHVTLFTGAEVIENRGSVGNFMLKVKVTPRYFKLPCSDGKLQEAIDVCPVIVPDEFNFNITSRKAIYHNYPSEYPQLPAIDMENCTRCGKCENVCSSIDFTQKTEYLNLKVGSVLLATGYDPYEPKKGEFAYGEIDHVVTLPQFKRIVHYCDEKLSYKGKDIKHIAYIYCVGSRQVDGENKYCSRYCCTVNIHTAITVKKKYKNIYNYHFNRGIRTYGKQEVWYDESSRLGDIYLQSFDNDPPVVEKRGDKILVKIKDVLTTDKQLEVVADLVVLVTGMVPRKDNSIGNLLKIPKGRDNFFNEIHMKLRPVETVIDGVTIAGASQGPKNVMESVNSALAAATKSFSLVDSGELALEPTVAEVDEQTCEWCGKCDEACPFNAFEKVEIEGKLIARVNPVVCKGCGMCLPVCPVNALNLIGLTDKDVENMISALIPND
ncbi:MAG: CoB--CoM heterodisulfide reductase iron-sulfur subunit A family protein [Prolixibacteraceae bacterium]|jgi:heterodisulfide reductase subunit A2|nr:CoB--CoM heterodisulfide reductase iron-sulfur subunit A family protein [Prolixibacteraceae bacterium]MBT6763286.1 CoB--CoM heterodisulfide reductase iron-sulfur subunit A family protein [Prolixibacteraceae bacterium]MBT6998914.1 CoB--CoM heterodisulfide reductase iron-sulfur subunit A family protein [Prolixibacteraceae bacterium]MBT7395168.1 CoB--CoM heterodisulfide reductase iron-sulfur subunit A family protein [Prolixibacteraceae bacterium]